MATTAAPIREGFPTSHVPRPTSLFAALLLLAVPSVASAQFGGFGPNKIQYRSLDWRVLHGEHIDLHFYPEEDELARVALTYAEESYRELEARFAHSPGGRVPLVLYATHADFEQTNLLPFVPPEGLLGFTEFGRSRVVLPFRGSYVEFRHTIRHEMVHVFQLSIQRFTANVHPRVGRIGYPLWFGEGLAEYWSGGEDTQDDMVLRDLTSSSRMPTIAQLEYASGGIVYAIGGSLVRFLAERYGDWRLVRMYDDAWKFTSFNDLLASVYGRSLDQLTAEWHYAMRRRYYPLVEEQRPLALDAHRVARLAIKPAVWTPRGDSAAMVVYLSPRTGYTDVYAVPLGGGETQTLLRGERSAQFESFHTFDSRIDVDSAGTLIFASRYLDRDALFFYDLNRREVTGRYQFPEIVSMLSPAWSPDGRRVVFSGLSLAGYSDLYLLHLDGERLERLTNDRYKDADPSFSPDGTRIVFSSDRAAHGDEGATNLYVMDLATRRLRPLTSGHWKDTGPRWSAEADRIVFVSDRRGTADLYVVDSTGAGRRETGVPGGIYDPVWVESAGRYVFGAFEDLSWNIYTLRRPPPDSVLADSAASSELADVPLARPLGDTITLAADVPPSEWRWLELEASPYVNTEPSKFDRRFRLDFAGADATAIPGLGYSQQGLTFVLSDLLADHLVGVSIVTFQQAGGGIGDFFGNINGVATYINQSRRLNWGVGAFRVRGHFYENSFERTYRETAAGVFGILRYPITRFTRVEARMQFEHSRRLDDVNFDAGTSLNFTTRTGLLSSNYLTWVTDNSLWLPTGPIDGGRVNLTGGVVTDLTNARLDSWTVSLDARRYVRTTLTSAFAARAFLYVSGGERPQRIGIGGSNALRGYPRYAYLTGNMAAMFNLEWRFPLTDYLSFGFPFGDVRFPGIQGALFGDVGRAWTERTERRGVIGSYGAGFRMNLGFPLVLRLDLGWRYGARDSGYSLPLNFRGSRFVDFWFGFNY